MGLIIPKEDLEKTLKNFKEINDINQLRDGDQVVMSVGTWCCRHLNHDWRWIKGFVTKLTSSMREGLETGEEVNHSIIQVSPYRYKFLRKIFPESITIDENQPFHNPDPPYSPVTYGRIFRYAG